MSYFSVPCVTNTYDPSIIKIKFTPKIPDVIITPSLAKYLMQIKLNIDSILFDWDIYKKYTNPYEYIHSVVPGAKLSISKLVPISRSFYKLVEIYNILYLSDELPKTQKSFHLAEGPGGFIEAMIFLRNNSKDIYHGMTLLDPDSNIPGWDKNKDLFNHSNVVIEKGADGTGNLLKWENLLYCYHKYSGSMDLITGDGGFDYSIDFNKQESLSIRLILSQITFAIAMQKKGGSFILKIFDIFTQATLDIIYLLSNLYANVTMIKPFTSRSANSERYIVCKKFKLVNVEPVLRGLFPIFNTETKNIAGILDIKVPYFFLNKIEEYNVILGHQQMENIANTLNLIKTKRKEKIESLKKNNIQKCVLWCQKNNVPYNKGTQSTNIFLGEIQRDF